MNFDYFGLIFEVIIISIFCIFQRKKRKDDTWTRQELSPALKRKSDQREKKEKPRIERGIIITVQ